MRAANLLEQLRYICMYDLGGVDMAYINPRLVTSPKGRVEKLHVIHDSGEGDYAVATMLWDGQPRMGVRWNGGDKGEIFQGLGSPQSRGIATWFILPDPISELVRAHPDALVPSDPSVR